MKLNENKSNMKATWKILNSIINRKNTKPKINSIFKLDGRVTSDAFEISNQFCNYFSNIGPSLARKIPTSLVPVKSFLSGQFSDTVFLQPVSENEIKNITKAFSSEKAAGYDNISMSIVKLTINYISRPLTHIVNLSLSQGFVPDEMKIAQVIPLYKAEDKSFVKNYRPISILPVFSKILEKVFYNRILNYLNKNEILYANQYGFRKGHLTASALLDLYDKISEAIDKREVAVGVFLDLSKAFDTVNHNILFEKLEYYGVRGIALSWIKSYFSNWKQFVQFNNSSSTSKNITCGVPQGSILGPLLFLIYINDICNVSTLTKLILFADDTSLFFSHRDPVYLVNMINQELEKFSIWLRTNRLSLNLDKTKFMIFKPRQKLLELDMKLLLNIEKLIK
jgi:retron-type reverse transcriptase